jgi:uncharacterized protein YjbJ (UPF0337 family)
VVGQVVWPVPRLGTGEAYTEPVTEEWFRMGMDDKASNKAEDLKGKAKETAGKATDDREMESEGKTDQSKSSLKQAGENVKDAFKG